jgi:chitosanase
MAFTEQDKLKALAIVNIFETSRPLGDHSAVAVLNDGAGVSYGFAQFTHRSGALCEVVERYLANDGQIGRGIFEDAMPLLRSTRSYARQKLAADARFKKALAAAAVTREMKEAQLAVAETRYLRPAIEICERLGFTLPLSLAVVYDSSVHGSWERIAARVTRLRADAEEKSWVTEYVRRRHIWLTAFKRLKATNYRTRFFLNQIAIGNWELRLPLNVHGVLLSEPIASAGGTSAVTDSTPASSGRVDGSRSTLPPAHSGGSDLLSASRSADARAGQRRRPLPCRSALAD